MKITKNYLHIGAKEPFCVLHASDTHITFADSRDSDRKLELSERRKTEFPTADKDLEFLKEKAIKDKRTVIYTGDLLSF